MRQEGSQRRKRLSDRGAVNNVKWNKGQEAKGLKSVLHSPREVTDDLINSSYKRKVKS